MRKICRACGADKPLEDFYRHRMMADGHLNKCRDCVKQRVHGYRLANIDRIREYDRRRNDEPERVEAHRIRKKTPEARRAANAKYYNAHPLKRAAHNIVGNAIRDGKLTVQPCERCGYGVGINAHHENYSKPLDVTWLCRRCHCQRHREINAERRKAA